MKNPKTQKACGPDSIRTEMLKYSTPELQKALLTLFNLYYKQAAPLRSGAKGFYIPNLQLCEQ
uniref:Uncharacterized protein n=1 Tax=Anguilla anguilla TaxID=7936 RepID=A0A0E9UGT4_ANGAN